MSHLDVRLFGRIVTACGFLSQADFDDCLSQIPEGKEDTIAKVLIAQGRLSKGQNKAAQAILAREGGTTRDTDLFDQLVDLKRHARAGDLHKALALAQELREKGAYTYLGELLAIKSEMTATQLAKALAKDKQMLLFCETCCTRELVEGYNAKKSYKCGSCRKPMRAPQAIDMIEEVGV